jgi:hypothetical protein
MHNRVGVTRFFFAVESFGHAFAASFTLPIPLFFQQEKMWISPNRLNLHG